LDTNPLNRLVSQICIKFADTQTDMLIDNKGRLELAACEPISPQFTHNDSTEHQTHSDLE